MQRLSRSVAAKVGSRKSIDMEEEPCSERVWSHGTLPPLRSWAPGTYTHTQAPSSPARYSQSTEQQQQVFISTLMSSSHCLILTLLRRHTAPIPCTHPSTDEKLIHASSPSYPSLDQTLSLCPVSPGLSKNQESHHRAPRPPQ